jgi:chromosome segregation protein
MLKRLELVGFKSFAEPTRLDFAPGITAIVGPNGSGKSNIIDAVRWILGEQSAKTLRGGGMTDVIFNGTSSRKSVGLAEVSMLFDNTKRILTFDADEVQITRRVYRDGTGEYLINQQPHRLKDIKELFLGSGLGGDSYSIISQGRVETLLNASTTERRIIFEEAAGISRFRIKKVETIRKLEKLETDFEKIRVLVNEAESQLRKVRLEATKAVKAKEYADRHLLLRRDLALRDYETVSIQIQKLQEQLASQKLGLDDSQHSHLESEERRHRLEYRIQELDLLVEKQREILSKLRERGINTSSTLRHESERNEQLEEELNRSRQRSLELTWALGTLQRQATELTLEYDEAATQLERQKATQDGAVEQLERLETGRVGLNEEVHRHRQEQVDAMRQVGMLQSQASNAKQQLDRLLREREQRFRRIETRRTEGEGLQRILREMDEAGENLQMQLAAMRADLSERLNDRELLNRLVGILEQEQGDLTLRRSELRGRIDVLEQLERSQEGLGTGVREAMAILEQERETLQQDRQPKLADIVIGLVADHLNVPREVAPLIDIALGDASQRLVATDEGRLDRYLKTKPTTFAGRVGFIMLDSGLTPLADGDETMTADRWVTCDHPQLQALPRQLLGNVRIVPTLSDAREYAAETNDSDIRFITKSGELLEPDGTLTVGKHHAETGLLSRRSELKELRIQAQDVDHDLGNVTHRLDDLHQRILNLGGPIRQIEAEIAAITGQAGDLQSRIQERRLHQQRIEDDLALLQAESSSLSDEIESLNNTWRDLVARSQLAEDRAKGLQIAIADLEKRLIAVDELREQLLSEQTRRRVEVARDEEHLESLRSRKERMEADVVRATEEEERIRRHLLVIQARKIECQLEWLRASNEYAETLITREQIEKQFVAEVSERDSTRLQLQQLLLELDTTRTSYQEKLDQIHQLDLQLHDCQNRVQQLISRMQDDFQIDMVADYRSWQESGETFAEIDRTAVEAEIQSLKEKIRRQGSVDPQAIADLAGAELKYNELKSQYDDLTQSRQGLREIIERINIDSRQKLKDTFDAVRGHFQELYRKLFGGGQADLVLDEEVDILDAGVEIMAQPPGKGLMPLTLLSGGEKALTAVALVLAIFRSKPSPFCLLDEVDAALDEANTARLGTLIRDYTDLSQFILITHRKRTIACADVLHGITMQESGVSKLISVRFEDYQEAKAA